MTGPTPEDVEAGLAFLADLRRTGQSGSASFGNFTVGRAVQPGRNLQQIRKPVVASGDFDGDDLLKLMR